MKEIEIKRTDVIIFNGRKFTPYRVESGLFDGRKLVFKEIPKRFDDNPVLENKAMIRPVPLPMHFTDQLSKAMSTSQDRERDAIDSLAYATFFGKSQLDHLLKGQLKVEVKSKTRYITFQFEGREITLAGKNTGNKIEVGYSVYCDHIKDKRKNPTPKDPELSKKIALGRLEKSPVYSLNVSDEPHRFIDTALNVARTKILKGELIIKGIR